MTTKPLSPSRLLFIDWARGFAIALALFSHIMLGIGGWDALREDTPGLYGLRVLTRMATPTFILLFGVSTELAYARKWTSDRSVALRRIYRRAGQCFVALAAVAFAAWIGGLTGSQQMLEGLALLAPVINGDIFLFYVFALLIIPIVIAARFRFGQLPTLAVTLAWWPVSAALKPVVVIPENLDFFMSRFIGIGEGAGPSAMHAMPLVVLGMIVASYLRSPEGVHKTRVVIALAALLVGVIITLVANGPIAAIQAYAQDFRATNHPGYYLLGGAFALIILFSCWLLEKRTNWFARDRTGAFGSHSLVAFAAGNVIINIFIGHVVISSALTSLFTSAAAVAVYWLFFRWWSFSRLKTKMVNVLTR